MGGDGKAWFQPGGHTRGRAGKVVGTGDRLRVEKIDSRTHRRWRRRARRPSRGAISTASRVGAQPRPRRDEPEPRESSVGRPRRTASRVSSGRCPREWPRPTRDLQVGKSSSWSAARRAPSHLRIGNVRGGTSEKMKHPVGIAVPRVLGRGGRRGERWGQRAAVRAWVATALW